jgi:hypothetical protein
MKSFTLLFLLLIAGDTAVRGDVPAPEQSKPPVAGPGAPEARRTYTTDFALAEPLLSEGGNWVCGKAVGIDWADVGTTQGHAFGLESGVDGYDDSTALVAGHWGANQWAQATVYTSNPNDRISQEVELRLRSSLSPHVASGYEINFRCLKTKDAYCEIVRWNGPLNKFSYLVHRQGAQYGVSDGDVVKATAVGSVITVYINGVLVAQTSDSTYPEGSPGIGFFLQPLKGSNRDYGFTHFTASDGP